MLHHAYTSALYLALLVGYQLSFFGMRTSMHAMMHTLPHYFEIRLADFGVHLFCFLFPPGTLFLQPSYIF